MSKNNILTGGITLVLLSVITFLLTWNPSSEAAKNVSQEQSNGEKTSTASIQRFSLSEMVDKSGTIFRGTVLDLQPGTIEAGGAKLPTVKYRFRVDETFKGDFTSKDGVKYAEITMLGNIKTAKPTGGNVVKFSSLPTPPSLTVGGDYLMLLTPKSSIGLSVPIGLTQGTFKVYSEDKEEFAKNDLNNAGIFDGPVKYSKLADKIRKGGK